MTPYYQQDGITIYHADCLPVLQSLGDGVVDLLLTDPPYGNGTDYDGYVDTKSNLEATIESVFRHFQRVSTRIMLTPGVSNIHRYPPPSWTLAWFTPAGCGSGPWGFCCWQPVLAYGTDPYLAKSRGRRPDAVVMTAPASIDLHPCAKPIKFWKWLLHRGAPDGGMVLDPFMGSGTTLLAAKDLGCNAIGVDSSERYCEIAAKRLSQKVMDYATP